MSILHTKMICRSRSDSARLQRLLTSQLDVDQQLVASGDLAATLQTIAASWSQGDFALGRAGQHDQLALGAGGVERHTVVGHMDDHLALPGDDLELRLPGLGDHTAKLRLAVLGMGVGAGHRQIQRKQDKCYGQQVFLAHFQIPFPRRKNQRASSPASASKRSAAGRPNSQNSAGVTKVSSSVELIRPEKITTATGCRISVPGCSASNSSGASAKAATSAVISTGVRRSSEPRTISGTPKASPSRRIRLR